MIIMLNGPFGVGKTSTAFLLNQKIENSLIFDPEEVGGMLRKIITDDIKYPQEKTGDFQDIILWRELTVTIAKKLIETYNVNLIVPMTISDLDYFDCILSGFKNIDDQVYHFCLLAEKEKIVNRLLERGEQPGSWPFKQIDRCLDSFENNSEVFSKIIRTDSLSAADVVSEILESL